MHDNSHLKWSALKDAQITLIPYRHCGTICGTTWMRKLHPLRNIFPTLQHEADISSGRISGWAGKLLPVDYNSAW